jgi:hypothetical protein
MVKPAMAASSAVATSTRLERNYLPYPQCKSKITPHILELKDGNGPNDNLLVGEPVPRDDHWRLDMAFPAK